MANTKNTADDLPMMPPRDSYGPIVITVLLLLFPPVVLTLVGLQLNSKLLAVGTLAQLLGAGLLVRSRTAWRPPASGIVICLYLLALGWLWFATSVQHDAIARLARGALLAVALVLFVLHNLIRTGLEPRRQARVITAQLQARTRWPGTLEEFHYMPEVRALYRTVRDDPTLVYELFNDPRQEVQLAAMATLQRRKSWRWDEAAVVLMAARKATRPEVRAMGLMSLGSANLLDVTIAIGEWLQDPNPMVRKAACVAILHGGDASWSRARQAIRSALVDPALSKDGPLLGAAGRLSPLAICDLTGWTSEPANIAERCVITLMAHYQVLLSRGSDCDPALPSELGRQITSEDTPAILRIELAMLLRQTKMMTEDLQDRMTDPSQPSTVRLIAVESMLAKNPHDTAALNVLRGLGRQSNRETALAVARILQRYCNLDLGVPDAAATPKQIQDAVMKVGKWATSKVPQSDMVETPMPVASRAQQELASLFDDDDALGGLPVSNYPASAPGLN